MVNIHQSNVNPTDGLLTRLIDRFRDWRNAKISDPRFQDWALSFWGTRPLVRRRQKQLFDLTAGFVYSQVLYTCVHLNVFTQLERGPLPLDELARRIGMNEQATGLLVDAAGALGLLKVRADLIRLDDLGAALLANPGVTAMIEHHAMFYRDLADPVPLLKGDVDTTELSDFWSYATADAPNALSRDRVDDYSHLMAVSQKMIAQEVIAAYPFSQHKRLLDVGGGEGAFVKAVGEANPALELSTFDLPAVSERAQEKMEKAGLSNRYTAHGGSFFGDELPTGADVMSLIRVIYDHDDEKVLQILGRIKRALPSNGTLVISEPMANTEGAEAMGSAYFGFYLLAMRSGRSRSQAEISALLTASGFGKITPVKTRSPMLTSVLIATV